jgi:glucose-1-phosphate thymidylyltransferase
MDVKTAVILCAGMGSRLWPITLRKPKILVEVAGRTILDRIFDALVAAGIEKVVLVTSPADIETGPYLRDHTPKSLTVTTVVQDNPRGLGDATARAKDAVGDEAFLLYLGDELIQGGIVDFVERARRTDAHALVLYKEIEDPRRFGVVVTEGDSILELHEKKEEPPSRKAIVGLYAFEPVIFDAIARTPESKRKEIEITDSIQTLVNDGHRAVGVPFQLEWFDVGTFEALLEANRALLDREVTDIPQPMGERSSIQGNVRISHNVEITDSQIIGPVIIERGCKITNSRVGPYVCLSDSARITDSAVEDCIIGALSVVERTAKLAHSVLDGEVLIDGAGMNVRLKIHGGKRSTISLEPVD